MTDAAAEQLLYECDFDDGDLSDWLHEGRGSISPHDGALLMETTDEPPRSAVSWLKRPFEAPLRFAYDFKPLPEGTAERACCILMACATPMQHDSLLDFERDGDYGTYAWSRTMTVYTISYKRHHDPDEQFRRANIRILGGDTPPEWAAGVGGRSDDLWHQWNVQTMLATEPDRTAYFDGHFHRVELLVVPGDAGTEMTFSIDGTEIVSCVDDGSDFSEPLTGGWFGFRHFVGPERCLYDNVRITRPA
ncbi:MAG: DUF1961 family protein [Armatimonadia bacterium]|nr:DUF1961 family protein [Armatimonadia bacterium]